MKRYIITLQAPDRKGLVEQIANVISRHNGNWLDSEMRHFDGLFAALLQIEAPVENWDDITDALACIDDLSLTSSAALLTNKPSYQLNYQMVANDRPGLVLEISNQLHQIGINIEKLSSQFEPASHSGIPLFKAHFQISATTQINEDDVEQALYALGADVLVDKMS
ncbi:glycine cleavage system protein R [Shewanella intestini]|uniref:Glycine cleavage system transcriptional repressor n=1 Tax=Shewanella intestini TaxID=2017544 RepID=A0ABS5HYS8_9GAMM|nr:MULTISPECIES: ACT domain-containing protein [Shewanella]MBR9726882.1 amino acid-binding protein [Shewanella intestini]MRG34552.1 amino acid-binding protein [Shewanella sp. XMDDZSB0408]